VALPKAHIRLKPLPIIATIIERGTMPDLSATFAQFSTYLGESVTTLFSLLTNLATFFALATGLASLFFGRRLFWVFVATVGFIIGTHVAPLIYGYLPEVMLPFQDLIGLAIALVLAGTAIVMQRFATIIFGALALGIVGYMIAGSADSIEWVQWFFTGLFALAGGLLLYFFFDWTLILASVLVGSAIAIFGARATGGIPDDYGLWLFGLLLAAGLIYQGNDLRISARLRQSAASKKDGSAKQEGVQVAPAAKPMPPVSQQHANTVMVPLKPQSGQSTYYPQPLQPFSQPATWSPAASNVQAPVAGAPTASAPAMQQPTGRIELFPANPAKPANQFQNPDFYTAPVNAPASAPGESNAPAFPPTFSTNYYTQTPSAPVEEPVYAGPTVTPDEMAPALKSQSSMSFSDLWKWTPWRKSETSGTVNKETQAAAQEAQPFRSSPEALG